MKIYNTLTKKVEKLIPIEKNKVKLYTCGPTVYHYAHIGNLRTYIFEDILEKGLNYLGYKVDRCMNITDVGHLTNDSDDGEDKMLKGALREGKTVYEIADYYTNKFFEDAKNLNIRKPDKITKASDNIDIYIEIIEKLILTGHAYISNGNVYFDISTYKDYYKLSGKDPEELLVAVRDDVEIDISKKNPADFVLWFTSSKFENQIMKWSSPWGIGYPGWHIECSGISYKYLGAQIDIHCGGVDNIFPHHTNEIAQSESFLGHKWCNYWMHSAHLNDNQGKMSKSNSEFLQLDVLINKGYNPLAYRYFCLTSHYRNNLVFSYESLDTASQSYLKLKRKVMSLSKNQEYQKELVSNYIETYKHALENDMNTASMITVIYDLLKDDKINETTKYNTILDFDKVLSLDLTKETGNEMTESKDKIIKSKIEERKKAKENKDFIKADKIREELLQEGITLIDTREGTTYEVL